MPPTGAKIGHKTRFLREDPVDSATYVEIAEVKSIGGPSMSRDAVDATHNTSDDGHAEFTPGLADAGEIPLQLNFRPDHLSQGNSAGLLKDFQDGTVRKWRVEWPQFTNTPTMDVTGFLTGWEVTSAAKDLLVVAVTVKVSGKATLSNFA